MGKETSISWTDATFNPWWGCQKVSAGCTHCYAETFSHRLGQDIWGPPSTTSRRLFDDKHWAEPVRWNKAAEKAGVRRRVFCASMADVFEDHPQVVAPRERLWTLIEQTPMLDWQLLTKRPENMLGMLPAAWLAEPRPNVWLGTTVENQAAASARVHTLLLTPAAVRFLSVEPMLGPVDLTEIDTHADGVLDALSPTLWEDVWATWRDSEEGPEEEVLEGFLDWFGLGEMPTGQLHPTIDWVICGGESGAGARPMWPQWARDLRDQCADANVPFLFKQWGEYGPTLVYADGLIPIVFADHGEVAADNFVMKKLGKKAAGNLLDGVEHNAFPAPTALIGA